MYNEEVLAQVAGVLGVAALIGLIVGIICLVAEWKIYTKAGEAGWKCLIPFYNSYVMYRFSWNTNMFWVYLGLSIANSVFSAIDLAPLAFIAAIALLVVSVISLHKLSKSFGHGVGFTLGLLFLSPIFLLILGFGSSEYVGPQ